MMVWPQHLQPLPTIFADSYLYYITLEHCSIPSMYFAMVNNLKMEIGSGEKFGVLFAHVSHDLLNKISKGLLLSVKEQSSQKIRDFILQLVEDNHLDYQGEIKQKASSILRMLK